MSPDTGSLERLGSLPSVGIFLLMARLIASYREARAEHDTSAPSIEACLSFSLSIRHDRYIGPMGYPTAFGVPAIRFSSFCPRASLRLGSLFKMLRLQSNIDGFTAQRL